MLCLFVSLIFMSNLFVDTAGATPVNVTPASGGVLGGTERRITTDLAD